MHSFMLEIIYIILGFPRSKNKNRQEYLNQITSLIYYFAFLKSKLIDRLCFNSQMEKWCNGISAKLSGSRIYNSRLLFAKGT